MTCSKQESIQCSGNCCHTLSQLGPYNITTQKWTSSCKCRSSQMECTNECKCDPAICKNRNITKQKILKSNESIRIQQVFGVDQYTRIMIEKLLPKECNIIYNEINNGKKGKTYFIENILYPAINNYLFFIIEHPKYNTKYLMNLMNLKHILCLRMYYVQYYIMQM